MKSIRGTLIVLFVACFFLGGCAAQPVTRDKPRILVMTAYRPEITKLRSLTEIQETRVINGRSYYLGLLGGKDVALVLSGTSMINAAMTTQKALDSLSVSCIVFSGIAGGVNPDLGIGDVVVPAQWGQYQEQLFAREKPGGWDTSQFKTRFPNYGMMFPDNTSVTPKSGKADVRESRFWFPASAELVACAKKSAEGVQLESRTASGVSLSRSPRIVIGGNGVSGQTFVDNAAYREWVWKTFKADALDMETAAVAHVAYANEVPFIAFRSLSDLAGGGPGANEVGTFFQLAADNSAAVVIAFLKAMPDQGK